MGLYMLHFQHGELTTNLQHDLFKKIFIGSCIAHVGIALFSFMVRQHDYLTIDIQPDFFLDEAIILPLHKAVSLPRSGTHKSTRKVTQGAPVSQKKKLKTFASVSAFVPHKKNTAPVQHAHEEEQTFSPFKPKKNKKIQEPEALLKKEQETTEEVAPVSANTQDSVNTEVPITIGYEQAHELRVIKDIKQAVFAHWKPPQGFNLRQACHIEVEISTDGTRNVAQVIQSSGILAYDMAARLAVMHASFPREKWGKKLVLVFNS